MDLEATAIAIAIAIAKTCNVNFIPSLIPFSKGRALFFCNSIVEATSATKKGTIKLPLTTVYPNNYHRLINVIETNISRFRGWIAIKALPLDSWNTRTLNQ